MDFSREKKELFLIRQIYTTFTSLSQKLDKHDNKSEQGLTARQYMVILAIRLSAPYGTTMAGIAKKLNTTKQNMTRLIHVLEKKGYVTRPECSGGRKVNVEITESGLEAMVEYAETDVAIMLDTFSGFSDIELELFWYLLQKIRYFEDTDFSVYLSEVNQLFENEYTELLLKILAGYRKIKTA